MKQENKIVGLYPLTKFYLAIVLVVLDIIMPGILSKLVVFVIINIIAALSDVWKSFIRKVRNSVGVLFVILLFIQTFFYPRGEVIFSFWILLFIPCIIVIRAFSVLSFIPNFLLVPAIILIVTIYLTICIYILKKCKK